MCRCAGGRRPLIRMRWQHRHQMCSDRQPSAFIPADHRRLLRARSRNFCSRAARCPLQNRGFSSIFVSLWHLTPFGPRLALIRKEALNGHYPVLREDNNLLFGRLFSRLSPSATKSRKNCLPALATIVTYRSPAPEELGFLPSRPALSIIARSPRSSISSLPLSGTLTSSISSRIASAVSARVSWAFSGSVKPETRISRSETPPRRQTMRQSG